MDELDLELVARLRTAPAPDQETVTRHHRQLAAAIQAAATTTVASPPPLDDAVEADVDVEAAPVLTLSRTLSRSAPGGEPARSRRRIVALAAATIAVAGGLFAATRIAPGGDHETTVAPPAESVACGTELPFTFPAPAGFEGPLPGPSEDAPAPEGLSPDTMLLHWQSADAMIDVRWPSYPPTDPTTPVPEGFTWVSEDQPVLDAGRAAATSELSTRVLGDGDCSGLGVTVTSGATDRSTAVLDEIQMALAGPGGPLRADQPPLVIETISAEALPPVVEGDDVCGGNPNVGGPVEGTGTYGTAREALGFFLAARPLLMPGWYQEITLPDGSFGYAYRPAPADHPDQPEPGTEPVTVVHVMSRDGGWVVTSYAATAC